jgi:HK97 family phage prohead protease
VAHAFGQRASVGNQYVQFARGAFDEALKSSDVRAFVNHDTTLLLGRQSAGTVRLEAKPDGLHYEIDLPETSYAADMKVLIGRGDLNEMSFGVFPGKVSRSKAPDGKPLITHVSVESIFDISPVSLPAFGGTSATLHHLAIEDESVRGQTIKARSRVSKEH